MATIETSSWDARQRAVHLEVLIDEDKQRSLALARHPCYPFLASIDSRPKRLFDELKEVANEYLARLAVLDARVARAARFAATPAEDGFGWLKIGWDGPIGHHDPRLSFAVQRRRAGDGASLDCTVVLMAGNRASDKDETAGVNGLQVGMRVVMHLAPSDDARWLAVRVTGWSACGLDRAREPANPETDPTHALAAMGIDLLILLRLIASFFSFNSLTITLLGLERIPDRGLRLAGSGSRTGAAGEVRVYQWVVEIPTRPGATDLDPSALRAPRLVEQLSEAGAATSHPFTARVFLQDAASADSERTIVERRVTRDAKLLERWLKKAQLPTLLRDRAEPPRFEVMQSRVIDNDADPDEVQRIDPVIAEIRSDALSAGHAFQRAAEFFSLMEDLGFRAQSYFKFARLPLRMRHRASFNARPDGNTVNAQVRPDSELLAMRGPFEAIERPRVEVCFGAAELRHRELLADTAQPMGLAADRRVAWHEFGHVLSFVATGALEFQFAHSVGDALAAVLSDPRSKLAGDERGPLRGYTFPWVPLGRHHDREARDGWCWCGRRNSMRRAPLAFPPLIYSGYLEEQMLSSSIFRLYRAIGGETFEDGATRERAANSCAYLIMRATTLLGPAALVPARSADAFVSALVDADIGTSQVDGAIPHHIGGCLHKVVRWAFAMQGLFATGDPFKFVDGQGLPSAVDLWIEDRRPNSADAGYTPVSLVWDQGDPPPLWHAAEDAVRLDQARLYVIVGNGGLHDARAVKVRAWAAAAGAHELAWRLLGEESVEVIAPDGDAEVDFECKDIPPGKLHFFLVQASCAEDRSNLDPLGALPCASSSPPGDVRRLLDLVANDNNLAFCRATRE